MKRDPIIEAAMQELAALTARRDEIEAFIRTYQSFEKKVGADRLEQGRDQYGPPSIGGSQRKPANTDEVMSAVHDILAKRDDALTLAAIFNQLHVRGVVIGGNNPKQNLCQKLSSHSSFKSYGKRGWFFSDRLPRSLQPIRHRLSEIDDPDEEGPDSGAARPLQSNGATGWSPDSHLGGE